MFTMNANSEPTKLEELIDELISEMMKVDSTSEEYAKMAANLVKLYGLKNVDFQIEETAARVRESEAKISESNARIAETNLKIEEVNAPKKVSPDTLAIVVGNLAGILLIIGFEKANVMTSKAVGFLLRTQK